MKYRVHAILAGVTGALWDRTGFDPLLQWHLHHAGKCAAIRWMKLAKKLEARQKRINESLHELGIYQR